MSELKPTRIVLTTGTPVVLTQFAPSFDALIYEALTQATGLNHDEIIEKMKSMILWNDELGVFHASSLRFIVTEEQALTRASYIRVDAQKELLRSENFLPNGSKGKYAGVMTAGGPFKKRISERLAYSSPMCCFDVVCDQALVKKLLINNLVGVGYDAFSAGMGEISSVEMLDLDEDVSIQVNGKARRNLPVKHAGELNNEVVSTPVIPPYYLKDSAVESYIADRISTLPLSQIGLSV